MLRLGFPKNKPLGNGYVCLIHHMHHTYPLQLCPPCQPCRWMCSSKTFGFLEARADRSLQSFRTRRSSKRSSRLILRHVSCGSQGPQRTASENLAMVCVCDVCVSPTLLLNHAFFLPHVGQPSGLQASCAARCIVEGEGQRV